MYEKNQNDPMEEGQLAAADRKPRTANPYPAESDEHDKWDEGYDYVLSVDDEGEPLDDA
jgi:hypothetical protein